MTGICPFCWTNIAPHNDQIHIPTCREICIDYRCEARNIFHSQSVVTDQHTFIWIYYHKTFHKRRHIQCSYLDPSLRLGIHICTFCLFWHRRQHKSQEAVDVDRFGQFKSPVKLYFWYLCGHHNRHQGPLLLTNTSLASIGIRAWVSCYIIMFV